MTLLLNAVESYVTNHNGQYPDSLDQLTASGDLGTTNFAGNLGLNDFELMPDGATNQQGNKMILGLRDPIPRAGRGSVTVFGGVDSACRPQTEVMSVDP
jgi:hypothetical protein